MKLIKLHLQNFRRHKNTVIEFQDGTTLIYGLNGSGKTNVLEAIHYAALAKSLINASDSDCLKFGEPFFEIDTEWETDRGISSTVRVYFSSDEGKNIFVNKSPLVSFSKIIGEYPCVSLSPYDIALVQGTPQERRRFLDSSISQTNKAYLADLLAYKRVLNQRNKLLSDMKQHTNSTQRELLLVWTESFARLVSSLIYKRIQFVKEFACSLTKAYQLFHSFNEVPSIHYESDIPIEPDATIESILSHTQKQLIHLASEEIRRGITLLGAHRDDLSFRVNDNSLKKFASQGQQKTFVICLKLAQHFYIQTLLQEKPIFLLDDVFSELDRHREDDLLDLLKSLGQSIITTTENREFKQIHQHALGIDGIHTFTG